MLHIEKYGHEDPLRVSADVQQYLQSMSCLRSALQCIKVWFSCSSSPYLMPVGGLSHIDDRAACTFSPCSPEMQPHQSTTMEPFSILSKAKEFLPKKKKKEGV